ncbi:hypothetical protein R6Z07F_019842 [Ovis aries]
MGSSLVWEDFTCSRLLYEDVEPVILSTESRLALQPLKSVQAILIDRLSHGSPPSRVCVRSLARSPSAVPGGAIFVPGERRRSTRALKLEVRLPSSRRDRIQEIRGGPRWEGRTEGGGREGGGGGSHRTRAPLGAHPRGVGRGSGAGPGPPAGAGDWCEGEAAAAANREQRLRISSLLKRMCFESWRFLKIIDQVQHPLLDSTKMTAVLEDHYYWKAG